MSNKITIITGAQGSGKTSLAYQLLSKNRKTPKHCFINSMFRIRDYVKEDTEVIVMDLPADNVAELGLFLNAADLPEMSFRPPYQKDYVTIKRPELIVCIQHGKLPEIMVCMTNWDNVEIINL